MFKVEELLPCPFCGSQPEIVHLVHPSGVPGIRCTFCHFVIKADRHDKVVGMWNSRKGTREKELEAAIDAVSEGSDQWRSEYDECRAILGHLVDLKTIKDADGKTPYYLEQQPLAWDKAKGFLKKYQHQ